MEAPITENTEQAQAYRKFTVCIQKIANNPFVTEASRKKKEELSQLSSNIQNRIDPSAQVIAIPIGSVGAGMAIEKSDIDAFVFVSSKIPINKSKAWPILTNNQVEIKIFDFDNELRREIRPDILDKIKKSEVDSIWGSSLEYLGFVFAPTTDESDSKNSPVYQMRKKILEKIVTEYPVDSTHIWNAMKALLKHDFVNYKDVKWGEGINKDKRFLRVQHVFRQKLREKFPENKVLRAKQLVESMQESFDYPDLETMCQAFEVKYPLAA